jgi:hypothetical protein
VRTAQAKAAVCHLGVPPAGVADAAALVNPNGRTNMSTSSKPDISERQRHGTTTERESGTGVTVIRHPDGRVERVPVDQAQKLKTSN